MDRVLAESRSLGPAITANRTFFIQAEQDGLFFGLEFLQSLLSAENSEAFEITAYKQDGECVFKGQILLKIQLKTDRFKKEDLISVVSYLSGACSLTACFAYEDFDFSIMACSTQGFCFSKWEEKALLKAGAVIGKSPSSACSRLKEARQILNTGRKQIALNAETVSVQALKRTLDQLPSFAEISLQGPFLPSDLEELRGFCLKAVFPSCLQGYFPRMKMKAV